MKKLVLIFTVLTALLNAEILVLDSFNGTSNRFGNRLQMLPKSPPVFITKSMANVIEGQAYRISAKTISQNVVFKQSFVASGNKLLDASKYNTLSFFIKTDTLSEVEVGLEDGKMLHSFIKINNFLGKQLDRNWKRIDIPLHDKVLDPATLKAIYFRILPGGEKDIIYLDYLHLTSKQAAKHVSEQQSFLIHDFEEGSKNRFGAIPYVLAEHNSKGEIEITSKGNISKSSKCLQFNFHKALRGFVKIKIPILGNDKPLKGSEFSSLTFYIKAAKETEVDAVIIYEQTKEDQKKYNIYEDNLTNISGINYAWRKVTLPLNSDHQAKIIGIELKPKKVQKNIIYLDNFFLE